MFTTYFFHLILCLEGVYPIFCCCFQSFLLFPLVIKKRNLLPMTLTYTRVYKALGRGGI